MLGYFLEIATSSERGKFSNWHLTSTRHVIEFKWYLVWFELWTLSNNRPLHRKPNISSRKVDKRSCRALSRNWLTSSKTRVWLIRQRRANCSQHYGNQKLTSRRVVKTEKRSSSSSASSSVKWLPRNCRSHHASAKVVFESWCCWPCSVWMSHMLDCEQYDSIYWYPNIF